MKTAVKLLTTTIVLAAIAYASPLMGIWKGELDGKPITITLRVVDRHLDGRFAAAESPQEIRISNAKFSNNMNVLTFQVPNQNGGVKLISSGPDQLTFEMQLTGAGQAVLRRVGEPNAPEIRMTRTSQ